MAKTSMVLGIICAGTFLFGLIPLIGIPFLWGSIICGVIGLILGLVALLKKQGNKGQAITGIILGGIFATLGIVMIVGSVNAINDAVNELSRELDRIR